MSHRGPREDRGVYFPDGAPIQLCSLQDCHQQSHVPLQVEHDFILPAERETFIEQMKDIMDKAEDMLSEDTDADHGSDTGTSPPHLGTCGLATGEVRAQVPRTCWWIQQAGGPEQSSQ